MRQSIKYISILFLFLACRQKGEDSRYKIIDLKYSVYTWNFIEVKNSWDFYLVDYFHIDTNGRFELQRRDFSLNKLEYFKGIINRDLRNDIDSILIDNKYFPKRNFHDSVDTNTIIYDGFDYLLDYKLKGKEQTKIEYINTDMRTPENILHLTSLLDTFILKIDAVKCDSFSIGTYLDTLKIISSRHLPPPPIKPTIKLVPPKIK